MLIQEEYFKNIFNTVREAILILDENMKVLSANRGFYTIFKVDPANTIGSLLYDLGNGQWNIPYLRVLLEDVLPKNDTVDDYEIEHNFESIGRKTMLLNACKIREKKTDLPIILLAIEDITERKRLEDWLAESEMQYRRLFETASDGIVLLEKNKGHIVRANPAAVKMLGYSEEEYTGKMLQDIGVSLDMSDFAKIMESLNRKGILNYEDVPVETKSGRNIDTDIYLVDKAKLAQCNIRDVTERKRAEEALRESEERFRLIAETITEVFWMADNLISKMFYISPGYESLWGRSRQSLYENPRSFIEAIYADDRPGVLADFELKKSGLAFDHEYRILRPDGTLRWIWDRGYPVHEPTGEVLRYVGVAQDITERKRAEEKIKIFAKAVEGAYDSFVLTDMNGNVTYANESAIRAFGYSSEEIMKLNVTQLNASPEDAANITKNIVDKGGWSGEVTSIRRNKEIFPAILSVSLLKDNEGNPVGMTGVFRDITERKQSEEELKILSRKIGLVLNSAGEGIYGVDMDGKVTFINSVGARMLGYEAEELFGKQSHATWHHHNPDGTVLPVEQCALNEVLKEGTPSAAQKVIYWKKDGTELPVEYSSTPMLEDDKLLGAVVTFKDITSRLLEEQEHQKLEEQLRHAQKMEAVGILAGGVAHDFNNILNVIIGYGTMLMDRLGDDHLSKEQLNEVLTAADRAANLTKRLLTFSRKQVVEVKPVNVNEIIMGMEKMLSRIIGEDIAFTMELASRKMIVMADAGQIEQVLMNLITNARYAMPKGGKLTIRTGIKEMDEEYITAYGYGKAGTYAVISAADTGSGMDAETQMKIFEPFFTTKGIGEGTGLGLSIVYGIIRQHNGYINVYSEPGKGTEFKIYLPLIEEKAIKGLEVEAVAPGKGGTETILLAEDDASLRKLFRIILEALGYTVITAEDGAEAATKYRENRDRIALVVLDMIMPKKNGKEAYTEIKNISPGIKALFVSGYTMDIIHKKELLDNGMDFILKPVSPRDLVKKVREILDR